MTFSPWRWRNQRPTDVSWLPIGQPVNVPQTTSRTRRRKIIRKILSVWWLAVFTGKARTSPKSSTSMRPISNYIIMIIIIYLWLRSVLHLQPPEWEINMRSDWRQFAFGIDTWTDCSRAQWKWMNGISFWIERNFHLRCLDLCSQFRLFGILCSILDGSGGRWVDPIQKRVECDGYVTDEIASTFPPKKKLPHSSRSRWAMSSTWALEPELSAGLYRNRMVVRCLCFTCN